LLSLFFIKYVYRYKIYVLKYMFKIFKKKKNNYKDLKNLLFAKKKHFALISKIVIQF